ncbi:hypothetical protein LSCM4_03118 [Leishmania orientalis]|uniref:Uncharacterized protein n=1 Tax=Leishmania orientalis TaxID=2249476 RepID=A0A836GTH6_9TRYP|nr:hypothetical protein LSCM4_03118 [Leishmania orientalis]
MRPFPSLRCTSLRTPALDRGRTFAAPFKAASLEGAHSCLPDAGGEAAKFRQLKDGCDALRSRSGRLAASAGLTETHRAGHTGASNRGASGGKRAHILEERCNVGEGRGSVLASTWDYGAGTQYANESTRNFYRAYSANYCDPRSTGFTREEVAYAERATRLRMLKGIGWKCLVYGSALYLLLEYWRDRGASTMQSSNALSCAQWEKAGQRHQLRQTQPKPSPSRTELLTTRHLTDRDTSSQDGPLAVVDGRAALSPAPSSLSTAQSGISLPASAPSCAQPSAFSVTVSRNGIDLDMSDEDDDDNDES